MPVLETLSGAGMLLRGDERRSQVTYNLQLVTNHHGKDVEGVLIGEAAEFFAAWDADSVVQVLLNDGRAVIGLLISVEGGEAFFRSNGEQPGF